eukprot:5900144-Amphidinium_carterae.1
MATWVVSVLWASAAFSTQALSNQHPPFFAFAKMSASITTQLAAKKVATAKQSARAKLTFQPGQLTEILQRHVTALKGLRTDVHEHVQQQQCHEVILQIRACSPRLTPQALHDGFQAVSAPLAQKLTAATILLELWQNLGKRARNSTTGARHTKLEKAFKAQPPHQEAPPHPQPGLCQGF